VIGHVVSYYSSGADQRAFSDGYTSENDRSAADRCAPLYPRRHNLPVRLGLEPAVLGSPWVQIVDEHHSVADEYVIFNGDPFANESVRRNLAPVPHNCVFLNLDEGPDLGLVAHPAAIKVDQIRLEDLYSVAQDNIGRNWHEDRCVRFFLRKEVPDAAAIRRISKNGANRTIQQNCAGINYRGKDAAWLARSPPPGAVWRNRPLHHRVLKLRNPTRLSHR
jgi:hypothetical protein